MTDSAGQTIYNYDNRNRLISETRTGQNPYTITYAYDAASRLVSMTYPDQSVVTYEYDWLNRLTAIPGYAEFSYNQDMLLTTMTYENEITTTYQYDNRDRTTNIYAEGNGTDFLSLSYQYDFSDNVTQFNYDRRAPDNQWVQSREVFQYDELNRLIAAQGEYGSLEYSYDSVGNRISQNGVSYTYNEMNELVSIDDGTTFMYDGNGNRTQKTKGSDTWVYTYDYANRLTKVEENGIIKGEYVYDGDGKRIQKTENGETTTYSYAGLHVLYEETTTGTAFYVYGPAGRLAKQTEMQGETHTFYYHTDHLGSTRLVTDESQNVVTEAAYKPFGEPISGEESYLYNGKEKDATGLYYYGARYYDSDTGTFITRDPLAGRKINPQSLNRYTYCLNNPVTLVDPAGLEARMCNITTGICTRETVNGLLAINENGNTLYLSDIQQKIDEEDYVGAVKLTLEFLGYEVVGEGTKMIEDFGIEIVYLEVKLGEKEVHVFIYTPDDVMAMWSEAKREKKQLGQAQYNANFFITAFVDIYFYDGCNMTAEELFHTVGHEMVHAEHFSTGLYEEWEDTWGKFGAKYYSEFLAYKWNLEHLNIVNFPGAQERYEGFMKYYLREFFLTK